MKVQQVYDFLNEQLPFDEQFPWDNSGLLIGDGDANVKAVCLCLDITNEVIEEAVKRKANLIISHHPVIFDAIKSVASGTPVHNLIKNKINAICMHTNADSAENGICDIMGDLLGFERSKTIVTPQADGKGYGRVYDLPIATTGEALAESCKKVFDCKVVRYTDSDKPIKRVAVMSGAGGSDIPNALALCCDAIITGDVKYHAFVDAKNGGYCVVDAGHFYTENILCNYLSGILCRKFHRTEIFVAENSKDPCGYII